MPKSESVTSVIFKYPADEKMQLPMLIPPVRFNRGDIIKFSEFDFGKMDYEEKGKFKVIDIEHEVRGIGDLADVDTIVYLEKVTH